VTSYKVSRRSFLRGSAAAPLLLPLLRNIEARAQGLPAPLRFLVIQRPVGTQLALWRPDLPDTTSDFTLPAISAPFAPVQSKMVMIDGINLVFASRTGGYAGLNTSEGGMVALMTGQPTLGQYQVQDHCAGGRSIDQIFLDASPMLGGPGSAIRTRVASLQLAADIRSDRDEIAPRVLSYRDPLPGVADINLARQPLFPVTQPAKVYDRLFGAGMLPDGALAQRRSIIDFARRDLARMRKLVPASELPKLDTYAESMRQLEATLAERLCVPPGRPPVFVESGQGATGPSGPVTGGPSVLTGLDYYDANDPQNHPHQTLGRLQLSMIRAAFLCDLTRVATFMWASGSSWVVFPDSMNGASLGRGPAPHHPPSHTTAPATLAWLAQIDRFYAQQTSEFLQELDATIDVDGNSLLDNTVVVYASEITRAYDHDSRNLPVLVFGGKNTRIRGGRFLKVTGGPLRSVDTTPGGAAITGNRPANDAWLALAPIFGVDLPSLGDATQSTGPLPGLVL
jgi:Protein of unknown function (DUF1552)